MYFFLISKGWTESCGMTNFIYRYVSFFSFKLPQKYQIFIQLQSNFYFEQNPGMDGCNSNSGHVWIAANCCY